MISSKFAAKLFLSIIAFSLVTSVITATGAFADTKESKPVLAKAAVKKASLVEMLGGEKTTAVANVQAGTTPAATAGPLPTKQINDTLKTDEGKELQNDEILALKHFQTTDMCDRTGKNWGVGNPTFLEILLKIAGDASDYDFDDITRTKYEDFVIKPETVPSTNYECFPDLWKTKYTEEQWLQYQDEHGTHVCTTFDIGCKIEKILKDWIRTAIVAGMTWILDIATGSGSGEGADACRPNRGADGVNGVTDKAEDVVKGFTPAQAAQCNSFLKRYYAMPELGDTTNHSSPDTVMLAAGKTGTTPDSIDRDPTTNSGDTSINDESEQLFYGKSSTIGAFLAIAMVIGAVIQGMVQGKPIVIFKVVFIYVPIFGLSIWMAPMLTKYLLEFVDGVAYYMADNSAHDIANVANAFGTTVGNAAGNVAIADAAAAVGVAAYSGLLPEIMGQALMFILMVGGVFVMQALALWALMMFREASILMVLALLPISFSMTIWPSLAKISHKFIKLLISLIVSKIPIVMALSMGLNMLSEWVDKHSQDNGTLGAGDGGMRQFVLAIAIFMIALAAPTFLISLFDAVGEMAGSLGRDMHKGISRGAAQAANLKGLTNNMGLAKGGRSGLPGSGGSSLTGGGGDSSGGGGNTAATAAAAAEPAGGGGDSSGGSGAPGSGPTTGSGPAPGAGPTASGSPADPTIGTPDTGESKQPGRFDDFKKGSKDITDDLSTKTDARGRPAKQFGNGGFAQHVGGGLYAQARGNQARNNASANRKGWKTAKNAVMAGVGAHIHGMGRVNAAGLRQKPAEMGKMLWGDFKAVKSIKDMSK